jgi:O-antigen/teichoic acid export membrane protein
MAKGAFWLFIERGSQQLSSIIVFAVIARLIGPEEYGYVTLCSVSLSLALHLTGSMVDGVISLHIKDDLRLSSLFWLVTASGAALSVLAYAISGPFAAFMGQERIALLLHAFCALPFLVALAAVPTALVTASMDFRVFTIRTLVATLAGGIVGIVMAIKGFGGFALAGQQIVQYMVINMVVWPGCGWRPRMLFAFSSLSEALRLGMGQAGSSFVNFFEQQIPRQILGYFLGPVAVGQYGFVTRLCSALQDGLVQPILVVVYPAFAQIRDDHEEQRKILDQLILAVSALIIPAVVGATVTAPVFVPLLFGATWIPAVPLLQLLLFTQIGASISTILRDFLRAHKLIGSFLPLQSVVVFTGIILSLILVSRGLMVIGWGIIAMSVIATIAYTVMLSCAVDVSVWQSYMRLWAPVSASVLMYAAMLALSESSLRPANNWHLLITDLALGGSVYVTSYTLLQFRQVAAAFTYLKKLRNRQDAV